MIPGEAFELKCLDYLNSTYGSTSFNFHREGGMDSTKSDISVQKNGNTLFYIEAKDSAAQSGQFVLLPNEEDKQFTFSPKNKSEENEMTSLIIAYMNKEFDRFNKAGTKGELLNIDKQVFANWIIQHYKSKNVKYVISMFDDFVIIPIEKFADYFEIKATFRIKKSGSGHPAKKDTSSVCQLIKNCYPKIQFFNDGKKLFAKLSTALTQDKFVKDKYTYFLAPRGENLYEITRLSNTNNMNVIFSINLKQSQIDTDLAKFEKDIAVR